MRRDALANRDPANPRRVSGTSISGLAAVPSAAEPSADRTGVLRRVVAQPLWVHALLLLVVVAGFAALSRPGTGFSSDEGAALTQARVLRDTGDWYYRYPLSSLDGARDASPFLRADIGSKGVAPYAKHPLYPVVLRAAGADTAGALALSVLGTVGAAVAAALLTRRFSEVESSAVLALWLTGVATPLLFDSGLVIAHTLAAAAIGGVLVLSIAAVDGTRRRWASLLGAAACALVAAMLRTEGVLVVGVLAVVLVVVVRSRWSVLVAGAVAAAGTAAVVIDRLAVRAIVGVPELTPPNTVTHGIRGRWDGFYVTWLSTSYRPRSGVGTMLWIVLAAVAVAAILLRRGTIRPAVFAAVAAIGTAAYALRLVADPAGVAPGLLVTVPVLWALAWFGARAGRPRPWTIGAGAAIGGAAVILLTQYSIGGGVEWGGRYFALLLPVAVAVVVAASFPVVGRVLPDPRSRAVAGGAAVAVTVLVAVWGLTALRQGHERAEDLSRQIAVAAADVDAAAGTGRPLLVTSNRLLPQLLHDDVDRYDWIAADEDRLPAFVEQEAAGGAGAAVLVVPTGSGVVDELAGAGWDIHPSGTSSVYDILVLERTGR